ncbi:hypothetical protein DL240_15595 [Lujinxingia litoralis]|uniref:Aminoglycoside N(3)-acetyltransferase n=1 Tax=Lujinxingia litoralis TaxID=2211119 RepID=A0A328C2A8_9DELT|nr:AAC(3) family N-acetyltransferase [Lujinxingia litoralis]RAL20740.1 hypothetical protein DL240_15595 [Lujinxingia litoralis]
MTTYALSDLLRALKELHPEPPRLVFVHSSLFRLGLLQGATPTAIPELIFETLREHLGHRATICVPTFNFGFCRGEFFDRASTPSRQMGALAEFVRTLPHARRSAHPMQSIAAVGPLAAALTAPDTAGAFERGSSFDTLIEYDARVLTLGCGLERVSLVHWAEERVGVPYRAWKSFQAPYRSAGVARLRTYRMYARDLSLGLQSNIAPLTHALHRDRQLGERRVGASTLISVSSRDFVNQAIGLLEANPWALVTHRGTDGSLPRSSL